MDNVGFDAARWDHLLLVVSFVAIALMGLRLSHQWKRAQRIKARKQQLFAYYRIDQVTKGEHVTNNFSYQLVNGHRQRAKKRSAYTVRLK